MAFDHASWISSLKTKYSIPDEDIPQEANNGYMRQSDYDRNFNNLKQQHETRMAEEDDYHNRLAQAEGRLRLMQQYEQQFGPAETWSEALSASIEGVHPGLRGGQMEQQQQQFTNLTSEQVRQMIAEATQPLVQHIEATGRGAAVMIDFTSKVHRNWTQKYGTDFPEAEFSEFFSRSGTNDPNVAYQIFERPFAEKKLIDDHKKEVEEAERRGAQSMLSKHGIIDSPVHPSSQGFMSQPHVRIDPQTGQPNIPAGENVPTYEERRSRVGNAFRAAEDQYMRNGGGNSNSNNGP